MAKPSENLFQKIIATPGLDKSNPIFKSAKSKLLFSAILMIWSSLAILIFHSNAGVEIEHQTARKFEFFIREKLGKSPQIDPRIKILGLDDHAVSYLKITDIGLVDWTKIFRGISARKVKQILVDKVFALTPGTEEEIRAFQDIVQSSVPISVGAFTARYPIKWRESIDISSGNKPFDWILEGNLENYEWLDVRGGKAYGPSKEVRASFPLVGHLDYGDHGRIRLIARLGKREFIPHLSLFAGEKFEVSGDGIKINESMIPLDRDGMVPVNFPTITHLYSKTKSMKYTIQVSRKGKNPVNVSKGDVVVILPLLYTGNVDMGETPVGIMPRGFVLVSLINSILTNNWLAPAPHAELLIAGGGVLGGVLGLAFGALGFWVFLGIGALLVAASGLSTFVYLGVIFPWIYIGFAFCATGISFFAYRTFYREMLNSRLKHALAGLVSKDKLGQLVGGSGTIKREASEHNISLMFVDIVGFSIVAEQRQPREIFHGLKRILGSFTDIVHANGGTVDRTLGDGMLCFFGYSYDGEISPENHADQSLKCAVEIQKENMKMALNAESSGELVFPVRIGINTAAVYIGDLGNNDRVDFTIIGDGVNFAKRLETACEPFEITMGSATLETSAIYDAASPGFRKRDFYVKHQNLLMEAYEFDPFHQEQQQKAAAFNVLRKLHTVQRRSVRWQVKNPERVVIKTDQGNGTLVDISETGISLVLPKYLARAVFMDIILDSPDGKLRETLLKVGIDLITCEVRWGRPYKGEKYIHGFQFKNMSFQQSERLNSELLKIVRPKFTEI